MGAPRFGDAMEAKGLPPEPRRLSNFKEPRVQEACLAPSGTDVLKASCPWPESETVQARKRSFVADVASLLPGMKRMRLRPTIGQLRLQREAEDPLDLPAQVRLSVEPELLRAAVSIERAFDKDAVHFEISFPPQYPHRAPQVLQVSPAQQVASWRYEAQSVQLPRLHGSCWSSAMGIADIIRDLLEPFPGLSGRCDKVSSGFLPVPVPHPASEDVEMEMS
mmetsp:Transcript_32757/g.78334  ORF Transcript_32757/g.78334 Transcript_32757/m.78334 type:complete len:221 (-) Transcript_32757:70-732(-)